MAIANSGWIAALAAAAPAIGCAAPAYAQDGEAGEVARQLRELREQLSAQRDMIDQQARQIEDQARQLRELQGSAPWSLDQVRGAGGAQLPAPAFSQTGGAILDSPVGEAPPEPEMRAEVQAIPQEQGVLTPRGQLVFDPSIEYTRSSTNRLAFRGFQLVPGIQIGVIEASDADRDTLVGTAAFRYGLSDRLEIDARLPYVYRNDRFQVVQQRDEGIVRNLHLRENEIGDLEFGIRYQLNKARPLKPIWVASLRVKTPTGKGPFDVDYDEFGVATGLATGSGFWAVQPGMNFLLPSDPAVIFGGLSYSYHIAKDVSRTIGGAFVGRVDPGDAISANLGFGFAINPRFSYSLGYRHHYIRSTRSEIGDTIQRSTELQVGLLAMGMSYRVTERQNVNVGFEFGVTKEAPDVGISLRIPLVLFGRK